MHFAQSWEPVIIMKTKRLTSACRPLLWHKATPVHLHQNNFQKHFSNHLLTAYTSSLLAACGENEVCSIYKLVEKIKCSNHLWKKLQLPEGTLPKWQQPQVAAESCNRAPNLLNNNCALNEEWPSITRKQQLQYLCERWNRWYEHQYADQCASRATMKPINITTQHVLIGVNLISVWCNQLITKNR